MTISSFKQFLVEESKTVFFTFGRMNPPTIIHEKLFNTLSEKAGKNPYRIFLSPTSDDKDNPLLYESKVKFARKMFPCHGRSIVKTPEVKNLLEAAAYLYKKGYVHAVLVVGEDYKYESEILLEKYNGIKHAHGLFNFRSVKVVSIDNPKGSNSIVEKMTSVKLRKAVMADDFTSFSQGLPTSFITEDARILFNEVRKGLGLKEIRKFKNPINIKSVSDTREQYVEGNLYNVGDEVVIKSDDEVAKISMLGANYVIVETSDGTRKRKWLDAVEAL